MVRKSRSGKYTKYVIEIIDLLIKEEKKRIKNEKERIRIENRKNRLNKKQFQLRYYDSKSLLIKEIRNELSIPRNSCYDVLDKMIKDGLVADDSRQQLTAFIEDIRLSDTELPDNSSISTRSWNPSLRIKLSEKVWTDNFVDQSKQPK